ncbi:GNAT family N-acetyltransferase [Actinokineospora sp. G85]|uniref:GNAT family N-acetyltransferase n=1 Tax=Actinokineospora sp. G85 TaxID=3406626 RepID=UPI003C764E3C
MGHGRRSRHHRPDPPPPGITLTPVTDEAGIAKVVAVHEAAFNAPFTWLGRRLLDALETSPDRLDVLLAEADGVPVSAARSEYYPGKPWASLWGGGTVPEWRSRGIYRALVAHRAALALDRGIRWLHVDAMPPSRPILTRMGFQKITSTTPYTLPDD